MSDGALDTLAPAGPAAREAAALWWPMLWMGLAAFVVFAALLLIGLRRGGRADTRGRESAAGERIWLVGAGILQPLALIGVTFALTLVGMRATPQAEGADALVIEVTGHQWWYEVVYPEAGVVTANELHIPVGVPVEVQLTSADVVHSFWVPRLAGKTDMFPDGVTTTLIHADEPGEFGAVCAEFCGLQHTKMGFTVTAQPPDAFASWLADRAAAADPPSTDDAVRGRDVFMQANCTRCHAIREQPSASAQGRSSPSEAGPDLTHFASRPTLASPTIPNTADTLTAWLADPHALKNGVRMPAADLPEDELLALVAYLGGLR